tara:strand:- start:1475 stop:1810 length:336 start_codon:yes stop_codon:yes gene_type:complete
MKVMMSESLLSRVGPDQPVQSALSADFLIEDKVYTIPVTCIFWKNRKIEKICFGINNLTSLSHILASKNCDVNISYLDETLKNIFCFEYNIVGHHNYSYELQVVLEDTQNE